MATLLPKTTAPMMISTIFILIEEGVIWVGWSPLSGYRKKIFSNITSAI